MNSPLAAAVLPLLDKLDVFHLLKVLTGDDQPEQGELKQFRFAHKLLTAPVAGDYLWGNIVKFLTDKGLHELSHMYLTTGIQNFNLDTPVPTNLDQAKVAFTALLESVIENSDVEVLAAVAQCPRCEFTYGVTRNG